MARASTSRSCDTCANLRARQKISEEHVAGDQTAYQMLREAAGDEDARERHETEMYWNCVNSREMRYPVVPEIIQHCRIYGSGSASAQAYVPELKNPDNRCRDWKPKPSDPLECGFCKHYQKNDPWKGVKDIEKWIVEISSSKTRREIARSLERKSNTSGFCSHVKRPSVCVTVAASSMNLTREGTAVNGGRFSRIPKCSMPMAAALTFAPTSREA